MNNANLYVLFDFQFLLYKLGRSAQNLNHDTRMSEKQKREYIFKQQKIIIRQNRLELHYPS